MRASSDEQNGCASVLRTSVQRVVKAVSNPSTFAPDAPTRAKIKLDGPREWMDPMAIVDEVITPSFFENVLRGAGHSHHYCSSMCQYSWRYASVSDSQCNVQRYRDVHFLRLGDRRLRQGLSHVAASMASWLLVRFLLSDFRSLMTKRRCVL